MFQRYFQLSRSVAWNKFSLTEEEEKSLVIKFLEQNISDIYEIIAKCQFFTSKNFYGWNSFKKQLKLEMKF